MSNRYWFSVGALALVAAVAGIYVARMVTQPAVPSLESGTSYPAPRALPDFSLVDTKGAPATPATLAGHPTLVFFGFTHCPDICPTTLALLSSVEKRAAVPNLKVAFITVDPERDTPAQVGAYVSSFGGDFIGLTGSVPEILKVAAGFGVPVARVELAGGDYTMDHSAAVFALDSQARIVALFTPPLSADRLARDVQRLAPVLDARP